MLVSPMMNTPKPPHKIIAAVVTWSQVEPAVVEDLLGAMTSGVFGGFMQVQGTLLPGARNLACVKLFEAFKDFTHLMFIDADMCNLTPDHIKRLAGHDVDIVTPLMVRRKYPFLPACQPLDFTAGPILEELQKPSPGLVECLHAGTGCMLIKRKVLEDLREEQNVWFSCDRQIPKEAFLDKLKGKELTPENVYDTMIQTQRSFDIQGEDVYFCLKAREKGYKIHVDCGAQIGHIGGNVWHIGHFINAIKERQAQGKDFEDEHKPTNPDSSIVLPFVDKG